MAKCIEEMISKDKIMPLIQFGGKTYNDLEKNRHKVLDACEKVENEFDYVINLNTRRIHKKDCKCQGRNVIKARLVKLTSTGLSTCSKCIK